VGLADIGSFDPADCLCCLLKRERQRVLSSGRPEWEYTVAANQIAIPATGKAGDVGSLSTTTYSSNAKAVILATTTATWELQADTPSTAWLCVNTTVRPTTGGTIIGSECYKINSNGNVVGNKLTIGINGNAITFTN
jgi:hypothetical protein